MSKRSKACDITPKVRQEVLRRDDRRCIVCGSIHNLQIAHYVSRARGGLGIPQNLVTMCVQHHFDMDNGKYHKQLQKFVREHLNECYKDWDEKELYYDKWKN